jgi:mono/diheme cytochrome c family protein
MKISTLIVVASAFAGVAGCGAVAHADAAAGKATFTQVCAECHAAGDFAGENAADLQATLKKIVGGTMKHKKALQLTDAQIVDVAAYMSSGK